jgi:hypothetical protein
MSSFRRFSAGGLWPMFLSVLAVSAHAELRVGVKEFVPRDAGSANTAAGIRDMLFNDLATQILDAAAKRRCDISMIDIRERVEEARQTEKRLQDEGHIDPTTAVPAEPLSVNTVVEGAVGESGGEISWHVEVVAADGTLIASDEGAVAEAERLSVTRKIAERLMSRLCPAKAWYLKAQYNDLVLDDVICDFSAPFKVRGTGETAGIVFSFKPADDKGGGFTVGGTAGGVPWSGGGTYTVETHGEAGEMPIKGSWRITTPVGIFGDAGTIPGKLSAAPDCKTGDHQQTKPKAKKKK